MVVRTLFLSAVVATLGYADTFNSYCTIIQGGVVTASNTFSTLLPEGLGAACPDVNFGNRFGDEFDDYTHFMFSAFATDPEEGYYVYGTVTVNLHVSIGAYAQIPLEFDADPSIRVLFGQKLEIAKTQTLTIQQPTVTSTRFATLPELRTRVDWSDWNDGLYGIDVRRSGSFNSLSTQIIAPRVIEYGVPFDVTAIARLGGDWEATHGYIDPEGVRNVYSYVDLTTDLVGPTPVPEPSGFLLCLAALSTTAYLHRRSRR